MFSYCLFVCLFVCCMSDLKAFVQTIGASIASSPIFNWNERGVSKGRWTWNSCTWPPTISWFRKKDNESWVWGASWMDINLWRGCSVGRERGNKPVFQPKILFRRSQRHIQILPQPHSQWQNTLAISQSQWLKPFTPNIWKLILLTDDHTFLCGLVLRI